MDIAGSRGGDAVCSDSSGADGPILENAKAQIETMKEMGMTTLW